MCGQEKEETTVLTWPRRSGEASVLERLQEGAGRHVAVWVRVRGKVRVACRAGLARGAVGLEIGSNSLGDQAAHLDRFLHAVVELEPEHRRETSLQASRNLGLKEARGMLQSAQGETLLRLVSHHRDVDRRLAQVRGDLDPQDGDRADPRVGDLEEDGRSHNFADRLGHAQVAVRGH